MADRLAVYAGSFDPLTVGHLWMIEQASGLFDRLVVAVGINPEKKYMFPVEERMAMIQASIHAMNNVTVDKIANQFLVHYAQKLGARYIVRGIRTESDYEFERTMRNVNGDLASAITTVFLMPPRQIAEVSSSAVKGLIGPEGWQTIVRGYVPAPVFEKLLEYTRQRTA